MTKNDGEKQCCPKFDPEPWQDKEITWENKLFVKDTVRQFMHMPLPRLLVKTVGSMWKKIEEAGASPDTEDFLMLAAESSPWKGEIYINATKEIPNAEKSDYQEHISPRSSMVRITPYQSGLRKWTNM
jgi:hypothetical protein